jgi:hypothetical protein
MRRMRPSALLVGGLTVLLCGTVATLASTPADPAAGGSEGLPYAGAPVRPYDVPVDLRSLPTVSPGTTDEYAQKTGGPLPIKPHAPAGALQPDPLWSGRPS